MVRHKIALRESASEECRPLLNIVITRRAVRVLWSPGDGS